MQHGHKLKKKKSSMGTVVTFTMIVGIKCYAYILDHTNQSKSPKHYAV